MHVFTRRNAVVGWIATRIARRRLERLLSELAGNPPKRRWPVVGAAAAGGAAVVAGRIVTRHAVGSGRAA